VAPIASRRARRFTPSPLTLRAFNPKSLFRSPFPPAVAFQDVGHEDTFGTIAASLKTLLHTTDAVFGRIETRVRCSRMRTD
jgi:hypothetical protein